MFTEVRLQSAFRELLEATTAPPAPLGAIRRRILAEPSGTRVTRFAPLGTAAAIAFLLLALPAVAPAVERTIATQLAAVLHWSPPPPAPAAFDRQMRASAGTLAAAQARVGFTIVPPSGLPRNVVSQSIATAPKAVYDRTAHRWRLGDPALFFTYRRSNGTSFTLLARRFDPREGPPSKYVFEQTSEGNALAGAVRHDQFTWRNGDQVTSAVTGSGISAVEIETIRRAMRGTIVPAAWPPRDGGVVVKFRLPAAPSRE